MGHMEYNVVEEKIVHIIASGVFYEADVPTVEKKINELSKDGVTRAIIDIADCEISTLKTRKAFSNLVKKVKVEKIAFIGGNAVIRMMASFVMKVSGFHGKFFKEYDKGLKWLKVD